MIGDGGGFCDAVFFVQAYRAAAAGDDAALRAAAELAVAFAPSKERHLETTAQGSAFLEITRAAWPALRARAAAARSGMARLHCRSRSASRARGIALRSAPRFAAISPRLAANLVSAGVRLVPLGQTDGQRVLAALEPVIAATAERALAIALDEVGGGLSRRSRRMRHETQYTRLFRS